MTTNLYPMTQLILLIVLAPLVSGIITKIKNNLRLRKGPGIFQPYYNLAKYLAKEEIISEHASWIFRAAPYIVLSATVTAAALLPAGDLIALVFLLALGRFFLALASLDPASAFGGMGSSREMFISSLVEPVLLLVILGISLSAGTFGVRPMTFSAGLAAIALFLVTLAETGRIPVDNQETHLELTMVHEAMVLEYSGRSLAILELSAYIKQLVFFTLIASLLFTAQASILFFIIKLAGIATAVAAVELLVAKMRLFRVVDYLAFAGIIAFLSMIAIMLGV